MGTAGIAIFHDNLTAKQEAFLALETQSDGDDFGMLLSEHFGDFEITVGKSNMPNTANGMRCFAAQVVAKLKTGTGDIYIADLDWTERYMYHLYAKYTDFGLVKKIWVEAVSEDNEFLFSGWLKDLDKSLYSG